MAACAYIFFNLDIGKAEKDKSVRKIQIDKRLMTQVRTIGMLLSCQNVLVYYMIVSI